MSNIQEQVADFHVRLGRLEKRLEDVKDNKNDSWLEDLVEFATAAVALGCCLKGIGLPNHYYQVLFSLCTIICIYQRGFIPFPKKSWDWGLLLINIALTTLLFKVIIGGGDPKPLTWLSYPTVEGGLTSFKISWAAAPGSGWQLPLTSIQSFFLVVSLFAMMIGITILAGLMTFVLTLLAVPTLFIFDWNWALPGMIVSLFSLYLQMNTFSKPPTPVKSVIN